MTTMEDTVRPFERVGFMPASIKLPFPSTPKNVVECKLGGSGGTSTSFQLGSYGSVSKKDKDEWKESHRESEPKKVENEEDPEQYVEFCQAKEIEFTRKDKSGETKRSSSYDLTGSMHDPTADKRKYDLQYPEDGECTSREPDPGPPA